MDLRPGRCRLPDLLERVDLKQTDFAKKMKVSDSYITSVIKGRKTLSLVQVKKASIILGCRMEDLYEWEIDL